MALPAFGYAILTAGSTEGKRTLRRRRAGTAAAGTLLVTLPFYVPFFLSPGLKYALRYVTGARLAGGTTTLLGNNFATFLSVDAVYNSSYYLVSLSLMLLLAFLGDLSHWPRRLYLILLLGLLPIGISAVATAQLWEAFGVNWSFAPFALLFACCLLAPSIGRHRRILWLWLAASFLFYFFGVGDPRTHFYNVFTPWILLGVETVAHWWPRLVRGLPRVGRYALQTTGLAVCALIIGFPYFVFMRTDLDYVANYPKSRPAIYWAFTETVPKNVYFGIPHRVGWKAVSELFAGGAAIGVYNSNEISRITGWYLPEGLRTHCARPDYYVVDTLHPQDRFDSVALDWQLVESHYHLADTITLTDEPRLAVYKRGNARVTPAIHRAEEFGSTFDQRATPDRWMTEWPQPGVTLTRADFGASIRLEGYALESRSVSAGESFSLILYWRTTQLVERSYVVFVHLIKDGTVQQGAGDSLPDCGAQPTSLWVPGNLVLDYHDVSAFSDADCAECGLFIGMYDLHTGQRLPISLDGEPMPGDTLRLTSVAVTP